MTNIIPLKFAIENCYLRRLARNFDELTIHPEYALHQSTLDLDVKLLIQRLRDTPFKGHKAVNDILSSLFILYLELQTDGDWQHEQAKVFYQTIDSEFEKIYKMKISTLLAGNSLCDPDVILDDCLTKIHEKLDTEKFKKYPSMIEVYITLVEMILKLKKKLIPQKTIPASLVLMGDYNTEIKLKGLKCCSKILKDSKFDDFSNGNYYTVIYEVLRHTLTDKNTKVTLLAVSCLSTLWHLMPLDIKLSLAGQQLYAVLDVLEFETNLVGKNILFGYLEDLITIYEINCTQYQKKFYALFIGNVDTCTNQELRQLILRNVFSCMNKWLKYCWCTWKYSNDYKVISVLLKLLVSLESGEEDFITQTQKLIETFIKLCKPEEQAEILSQLSRCQLDDQQFMQRIKSINTAVTD